MAGQNKNNNQEVDTKQLLKVRREKLADLQERGKDPFQITKYDVTHHSMEIKEHFDELECGHDEEGKLIKDPSKLVSVAGRIMLKRVMGKASFCNIQDLQEIFRFTLQETKSVKNHLKNTKTSRRWILVILLELRDIHLRQRQVK